MDVNTNFISDDAAVQFMLLQTTLACVLGMVYLKGRKYRRRRWWVHPLNLRRVQQGDFHNLLKEMRCDDPQQFVKYMRMSPAQFDTVLSRVAPFLRKKSNRPYLPEALRLSVTLRFLATGDSIPTLAWSYRIGKSTCCRIINETTHAIWDALHHIYVPVPTEYDYRKTEHYFSQLWNIPHCVGALDGKHVVIQAPNNSGSKFFNYKKTFSIVLMAVCVANYCFTHVDIGAYGSQSDGGIFRQSEFGYKLNHNLLPIPAPSPLPGSATNTPYFFVGDEAFPLGRNLMRPFPKTSLKTLTNKIFNYRHSRARRVIENTFGILVARWRVFHRVINAKPETVDNIIKATVCLHNFLRFYEMDSSDKVYCPPTFTDTETHGEIQEGEWRCNVPEQGALQNIRNCNLRIGARNATLEAIKIRDELGNYFISPEGAIHGQTEYVLRGMNENHN